MRVPQSLVTDRLIIRPFIIEDLEAYLTFMSDEECTRHLMITEDQRTVEGATELFNTVRESYASEQPVFAYAIAEQGSDRFLGSCGLTPIEGNEVLECYYSLLREHWGEGYATEATEALLEYAYDVIGANEVHAWMSSENERSLRLVRRLGFEDRGTQIHPLFGVEGRLFARRRSPF